MDGFDDLAGGVEAGGAGEGDSRMGAGAAEEKSANGSGVAGEAEERAHGEKLVEGEFAVRDVAAGEAVGFFEVEGGDDAAGDDFRGQIGRVLGEGFDDGVGEGVAVGGPIVRGRAFRG